MKQNILLGYRRKSLVRGKTDLVSPERQAQQCELWVQMQDEEYIIEWYEDIEGHRSGRYEKNRPGWQKLVDQLDRPEVVGVIADSFDRMYRNVQQFLNFLNKMERLNKKLVTVKEGLDTSGHIGRAIVTILMVIYQLESDQTSHRMSANIKYKREELGRHWGPTPFGCDRNDDGHLIPGQKIYWLNPATGEAKTAEEQPAPIWEERRYYDALVLIYEQYSTGSLSYDKITNALNDDGWRFLDRWGNPRRFVRDDIRRAVAYWQLFRGDLPTGKIQRHNGPVLDGGHQPVLPVELCEQVGQTLARRSQKHNIGYPRRTEYSYILSSVLYCGTCGQPLKGGRNRGRPTYRHAKAKGKCPQKQVDAAELEAQVVERMMAFAEAELLEDVRLEAKRLLREIFIDDETNKARLAELDRQQKRLSRLADLYLDEEIDRDDYNDKRGQIKEVIKKLESDLYASSQLGNIEAIIDRMIGTLDQIPHADPESKKALINSIFERLDLVGDDIIHYTPRPWAKGFF